MDSRDFKVLLDVLERIAVALEKKKEDNSLVHFKTIWKKINYLIGKPWSVGEYEDLLDSVGAIGLYVETVLGLYENNKSKK